MGLETKIYSNHSLRIPRNAKDAVNLLVDSWGRKIEITDSIEVKGEEFKTDPVGFNLFICPTLIEYEYAKFHQIRLSTNFKYSGFIKIYPKTICFTPIGIGKNATNMIANFMNESTDFFHDEESFQLALNNWKLFKSFLYNVASEIGAERYIFINDGMFSGVEEIAWEGETVNEMITESKKLIDTCESRQ